MTETCTLRENINDIVARFLRCELAFAETIARIDLHPTDTQKKKKMSKRQIVRRSYDTVLYFLPKVRLSEDEAADLHAGLDRLRNILLELGD